MSNNISRKGLAWGALVAIAASLFATAPAHAAAGVTLAANSTSQVMSVPQGTSYQLVETASSEIPSTSYSTLAVAVEPQDAGNALVTINVRSTGTVTGTVRSTQARVVFSAATINASANNVTIEIRGTDSATHSFKVTSWLDANGNGVVDNGEYAASQTVTFYGAADLQGTTSFLTSPTYTSDARTVQVRVQLTNVNTDQLALASAGDTGYNLVQAQMSIDLRAGTYDARLVPDTTKGASVFASSDARAFYGYTAGYNPGTNNKGGIEISGDARVWYVGSSFTAQAYLGTTKLGAAVSTSSLVNGVNSGISIATVAGANALASTGLGTSRNSDQTATVRINSAYQVKVNVTADTKALAAGQSVTFSVVGSWKTGTARVTVNGVEYSTSADVKAATTFTAVTDADGNAVLNIAVTGFGAHADDVTNDITVSAKVNNVTSPSLTLFQTKAAADVANATATPAVQSVVIGSNAAVVVSLNDQFGQPWTATQYTAQAIFTSADNPGSTTAFSAANVYAALANGAVTLSFAGDANVTGDSRWTIQLRKNDTVNGGYLDTTSVRSVTVAVRTAAQLAAGNILTNAGDTTNGVRTSAARNLANATLDKTGYATTVSGQQGAISGYAVVTTGRAVSYAKVTVSGAGILFTDGTTYSVGSITVTAGIDGSFSVNYASNTSGDLPVSVTVGGASVSTTVTINAPANNSGRTFGAVAAPTATLLAGNTATVTFNVRDVYGNQLTSAATISVHVSGDVTRDVTYADQSVDAKGNFTVTQKLTTTGTAYFTATYSSDARLFTTQVRVDWAKAVVTVTLPDTVTAGQNSDVVVTVTDPAGNAISGVTVSGTSTGVGYLTVASGTTDSNGQATLKLYANENELGWAYVTASGTPSGSVASTSDATGVQVVAPDAVPTATDSVAAVALEVPATAQAGTVVDVVATATDADGNPVSGAVVSATSTGVGYLAIAGGTTDDNGQVVLKLVIGAGDNGTASVVANSGSAMSDAAQVTAGSTDANITLNKKRVTVDWSFAANKKVVIVRDGVAIKSFTASSNAADSFSFNLKNGTHKVSVKVGGVTLDSQSYKIAK